MRTLDMKTTLIFIIQMKFILLSWSFVLLFSVTSAALSGDIDPSFGQDGRVVTPISTGAGADAISIQPDGRIVVAGWAQGITVTDFALARFEPDGQLDLSFGTLGKVTTDFGKTDSARAVAIQPDGKIVVAGFSGEHPLLIDFAVARYNADGSLDNGFDGDGMVTADFGKLDDAREVIIQSDGKILIVGNSFEPTVNYISMIRYNADGTIDTNFGTGGMVISNPVTHSETAVLNADGKIIVAGQGSNGSYAVFKLVRFNSDGTLDTTFGNGGEVLTDFGEPAAAWTVSLQPDGKIVAGGITGTSTTTTINFALARYQTDGSLDLNFGNQGIVVTDFQSGDDRLYRILVQADDKILAAGFVFSQLSGFDFGLARYNSDGTVDTSFGVQGKVKTDFGSHEGAYDAALTSQDSIVIVGDTNNSQFALARYLLQGSNCLFCDTFEDGVISPDWDYIKPTWNEKAGSLIGTPVGRKALAIASPIFSGCNICTVETSIKFSSDDPGKIFLLGWYQDLDNTIELVIKEEKDKLILRQRVNGTIVAKTRATFPIIPDVFYRIRIISDGTTLTLEVEGTILSILPLAVPATGTVGFQLKNSTASFGYISVN